MKLNNLDRFADGMFMIDYPELLRVGSVKNIVHTPEGILIIYYQWYAEKPVSSEESSLGSFNTTLGSIEIDLAKASLTVDSRFLLTIRHSEPKPRGIIL